MRLAQEVDLDEIQCFEIYWKYQRETTQNLLLNDNLLKTKVYLLTRQKVMNCTTMSKSFTFKKE